MPLLPLLLAAAATAGSPAQQPTAIPSPSELREVTALLAPTEVTADLSALPSNERRALAHLVAAARSMDTIFLRQVWGGNEQLLLRLSQDRSEEGRTRLHAFVQNKGPWLRLEMDRPFLAGVPAIKPEGGGFYPADASKEELSAWAASLSPEARAQAMGFFTTVRRSPQGSLTWVPYSVEYQAELLEAAAHLREAAKLTAQPTLRHFLEARAAAFLSNDYYASDVAWMELDASIEPTLGPYEVYEDAHFNAKAAFESFIALRDPVETQKLARLSAQLQWLEDSLPIADQLKNHKLGALAPIRVVDEIDCTGDANKSVQTAAFNLPNDERIARERGTKRVMLKNVQQAKFAQVLIPISKVALAPADQAQVAFEPFFTHILMHELMHGLGPHQVAGQPGRTVREALQEAGSAVEEAKADIAGLWALQQLVDRGLLPRELSRSMYVTYLASIFRALRFGLNDAHGKATALQLNYLLDHGGVRVDPKTHAFSVDPQKMPQAVAGMTRQIMELQASGDPRKARALLASQGVIRPEAAWVIAHVAGVPVDIEPRFTAAEQLLRELSGSK